MALNYLGQEIPVTNFRFGGGLVPQTNSNDLAMYKQQRQDANMERLANDYLPVKDEAMIAPPVESSKPMTFADIIAMLGSGKFGGSKATTATSGDTSLNQQEGDTLGSITNFFADLMRTAMGGKASADQNATAFGTSLLGANQSAALANQASQERANRQNWVGDAFASLRPGFKPAAVPGASSVDTGMFTQGVPTEQIFGGGLGGADPLGILGLSRPSSSNASAEMAKKLGRSGGIKPFMVPTA